MWIKPGEQQHKMCGADSSTTAVMCGSPWVPPRWQPRCQQHFCLLLLSRQLWSLHNRKVVVVGVSLLGCPITQSFSTLCKQQCTPCLWLLPALTPHDGPRYHHWGQGN